LKDVVPLGDVATIVMGQSPVSSTYNEHGEGLPFFQGKTDFGAVSPRTRIYCSKPGKVAESGDILLSVRAPVGPTNVNAVRSCIGRGLSAIRINEPNHQGYLRYFLRFYELKLAAIGKGSTFEAVNRNDLEEIPIPLPSLDEQKRIAAVLERADHLRRTRRFARALSDSFLQSVFLQMFGDDLDLDKPQLRLGEVVTITGGGTPSRAVEAYFQGQIPWLTSKDMRGLSIYDTQEHITEEAIKNSATKVVPVNSILMVVKSKVLMHRLPLALSCVPLCHGQDIKSIQCSDKVVPWFILYLLKHNEANLLSQARGANTEGLNLSMIEEVFVPDVPLEKQRQFAAVVRRFERVRAGQIEAGRQAEHLFQTLLHRAFSP